MKNQIQLICFIFGLSLSLSIYGQDNQVNNDEQEINNIVLNVLNKSKIKDSGLSLSVFTKDSVIFSKGYGYSNREEKKLVSPETLFAIGSTTKAFTALGLKLLENGHQLKLTDKVLTHLPNFKLSLDSLTKEVTIEDLLSHRVGLPRHDLMLLLSDFSRNENFRRMQYLDFPPKAEENFRKKFSYNNFLIMAAGLIIEEKTNRSYEEFIHEAILKPLDMNKTFLEVPNEAEQLLVDLSYPYNGEIKLNHRSLKEMAPAGSIYSNVVDMTKWIQSFLQKKWKGQEDFFIPRIALEDEEPSLDYSYGLAWMINRMNPQFSWYFHGGNIDGFSAFVLFSHELNLGIVILENQNGSYVGGQIISGLLEREMMKRSVNKSFLTQNYLNQFPRLDSTILFPSKNFQPKKMVQKNTNQRTHYSHLGYGDLYLDEVDGIKILNYYGNEWILSPFDVQQFNYISKFKLFGLEHDIPFQLSQDKILIPFEANIPMINFERLN
jgi:CubicO group peptidase (beta-lactamase class C family)